MVILRIAPEPELKIAPVSEYHSEYPSCENRREISPGMDFRRFLSSYISHFYSETSETLIIDRMLTLPPRFRNFFSGTGCGNRIRILRLTREGIEIRLCNTF